MTSLTALRHKNFTLFVIARFLATVALQIQSVAVGWQIYQQTGNPLDLGFIGLAQFLPFASLILIAGHYADQWNRRSIMLGCFFVELICGLLLLFFAREGLTSVIPVFAVMALYGAARAFMMPASQAILVNLVPSESLANAVAINSSLYHIAVIAGPPLGGALYLLGTETVYSIVTVLLCISVLLMLPIRVKFETKKPEPLSLNALFEGIRFVRSRPIIFGALSLDLLAVLFGGATALLPAYANDVLHVDSVGLGLLRGAPALGATVTAIILSFFPITRRVGLWMFSGVLIFGVATVVFGASTSFELSLAALFLIGTGDMVSVYIRHILVQLETPDDIRGRVSAVNSVFIGASNELGEFESGMTAALLGVVPAVIVGGSLTIGVTLICMWAFPVLRKMNRFPAIPK
ncbi:MAG: MFS transporter [Methylococcales bacterium]|nr:MFS transporter [Methylococcales bacterium]